MPTNPASAESDDLHAVVLGQAEVHQPGLEMRGSIGTSRRAHQDVRRLDIAMHDAVTMDVVERCVNCRSASSTSGRAATGQAGDRPPQEQLHREERTAAELAIIEDSQAVGMVQCRERAELALEPSAGRAGERALHELERHLAAVAVIARTIDDAHAPLAELVADLKPLVPQIEGGIAVGTAAQIGGRPTSSRRRATDASGDTISSQSEALSGGLGSGHRCPARRAMAMASI